MKNALCAILLALPSFGWANALPEEFPANASEAEKTLHCVAVNYAEALASLVGAEMANRSPAQRNFYGETVEARKIADWLVDALGGQDFVADAQNMALSWEENWRASGETFWAAMMSDVGGASYHIREGQLLANHHSACLDFFEFLSAKHNRDVYSSERQSITLPTKATN